MISWIMATTEKLEALLADGDETLRPVVEVLKQIGLSVSSWTAIRWCRHGVRGLRLRAVRAGHRWLTRKSWALEFLAEQQIEAEPSSPKGSARRSKAWSDRVLASEGLGR